MFETRDFEIHISENILQRHYITFRQLTMSIQPTTPGLHDLRVRRAQYQQSQPEQQTAQRRADRQPQDEQANNSRISTLLLRQVQCPATATVGGLKQHSVLTPSVNKKKISVM